MGIYLREIREEDCDLLFKWANDEEVRKNSFNSQKIYYNNHVKWFKEKIKSSECYIFIGVNNKELIGQVRIELKNLDGIISYSIDKKFRQRGFGFKLLSLLEEKVINDNIKIHRLVGYVKKSNIASQKIFNKLKFIKVEHKDEIEYIKDLNI